MKRAIVYLAFVFAFLIPTLAQAQAPGKEVIETLTLQPDESKEVVVEANEKIRIGWNHTDDESKKHCKNNCIELINPENNKSFASLYGGSLGIQPKDGKAAAVFKNVESVPLTIEIFKKPAKK